MTTGDGSSIFEQMGGTITNPATAVERYADEAMFRAVPLVAEEGQSVSPSVTLIEMTRNPLRVIAAASEMYQGRPVHDVNDIDRGKALSWLDGFRASKISAPLEFVTLHFLIEGVTRAFTHQMVRQRTAVYVQESMRFAVKENAALEVVRPPSLDGLAEDHPWRAEWDATVGRMAQGYNRLVSAGMPAEDARGLLPTNIATRIHYHTNLRALVEHSGMRLCSQAQAEWKQVWVQMIRAMLTFGPTVDRWQQREIVRLFKPVCYQTGSCGFNGPADRWCVIRDRVNAHAAAGDRPETWTDIDPQEPLHPLAARRPQ
jgi:flavin-dependent thymidylate synthase